MRRPSSIQVLYLWHLIDGLTHLLLESTYVYSCFTGYIPTTPLPPPPHPPPRYFLSHPTRLYGPAYSTNIFAPLWTHYSRADSRYYGIDLTTLSLEIITVVLAGPLALYIASCIQREAGGGEGRVEAGTWFWAIVLASGELYGGLVNVLPEVLSGGTSFAGDGNGNGAWGARFWVYVVGFNVLWVVAPVWVLWRAWAGLGCGGGGGGGGGKGVGVGKKGLDRKLK